MAQTIYGNTEGLKKQVLTQLEAFYEEKMEEGQLLRWELALSWLIETPAIVAGFRKAYSYEKKS